MAIPTDFKGFIPAAGTTKTFPVYGTNLVGIWACDVDGTLSATCKVAALAPNLSIFMSQAYTDAQIAALLRDYLSALGQLHDGAGGNAPQGTKQVLVTAQVTA